MSQVQLNDLKDFQNSFASLVDKYYNDPITFIQETFKVSPTRQQAEVLKSLAINRKVSVKAGHGVGKSTLASWAVYWFLLTRPFPKIICTAPTFHQLYDILWAEAASWRQKSDLITNLFDWKQRRIEAKWSPENWWAAARTASKGESLTGRHAGHFMLVCDEASGIEDMIFEASEGMLTSPNSYVLLIGNPTKNNGYFYNSHNKDRKAWAVHTLSCYDSLSDRGGLVDPKWVNEMKIKYGELSNTFKVRVLGEFPTDEQDTLIPNDWVMGAIGRDVAITNEPLFLGVDVGAGGDLSAIAFRRGGKIEKIIINTSKDTMRIVGWIGEQAIENKADAIFIDPIGIGKGAYDRLAEMNFRVYPVDVRSEARIIGFKRLRDELWWTLRTQFERGLVSIPDDDDLRVELSGIKYHPESDRTIKIESKAEMRKRLKRSPDRADAICMTYYYDDNLFTGTSYQEEEDEYYKPDVQRSKFTGY